MEFTGFEDPYRGGDDANRIFLRTNRLEYAPEMGPQFLEVIHLSRYTEIDKDQVWDELKASAEEASTILLKINEMLTGGQMQPNQAFVSEIKHPAAQILVPAGESLIESITSDNTFRKTDAYTKLDDFLSEKRDVVLCGYGIIPANVAPDPVSGYGWYAAAIMNPQLMMSGLGKRVHLRTTLDDGVASASDFKFDTNENEHAHVGVFTGTELEKNVILGMFLDALHKGNYEDIPPNQEGRLAHITMRLAETLSQQSIEETAKTLPHIPAQSGGTEYIH